MNRLRLVMTIKKFTQQITPIKDRLYRFAMRMVDNAAEAEDVVQEVLIKLWQKRADLPQIQNLEAWSIRLTKNLSLDKLNKLTAVWIEDYNPISKKEVNNLLKSLRKDQFEPLIIARSGTANVKFMIQENGRFINSVILLIDGIDNFLLINLTGNLDYEDLSNMDIDINGMEHFKKLPKKRPTPKRA